MLLTVLRRTGNDLAPVFLGFLPRQGATAKGEQGGHESKNTLAKSHAILLRLFEASAPNRESSPPSGGALGRSIFETAFQRKGDGPLDYSNRETRQSDRAGAKGANDVCG